MTLIATLEAIQAHLETELPDYKVVLGYENTKSKTISILTGNEAASPDGGVSGYQINTQVSFIIALAKGASAKNIYKHFLAECAALQVAIGKFKSPVLQFEDADNPQMEPGGISLTVRRYNYTYPRFEVF